MKKFYFALDTVLNYKQQILEHLQEEHARIMAEMLECEREIERLEQKQSQCMADYEKKKAEGFCIREMQTFDLFLSSLRRQIRLERERLAGIQAREEKKREEVVEARKETASIEKLKEKKRLLYDKEVQKEEERFIEEFVSNKNAVEREERNTA